MEKQLPDVIYVTRETDPGDGSTWLNANESPEAGLTHIPQTIGVYRLEKLTVGCLKPEFKDV